MFYTVYKITNKLNDKIYIGAHKTSDLDDRYMGSGKIITLAIKKYGIENFEKEILEVFESSEEMYLMESKLVTKEFIKENTNYNLKEGGEGGFDFINDTPKSQEHIEKIRDGLNKYILNLNDIHPSTGIKRTQETKKKMSTSTIKFYEDGGENGFSGMHHTEETKNQISISVSKSQQGSGNSHYGKMWIYNKDLEESKTIPKDDIIPEGWIKGRVLDFTQFKKVNIKNEKEDLRRKAQKEKAQKYWKLFMESDFDSLNEFAKSELYPYSQPNLVNTFKTHIPEYTEIFIKGKHGCKKEWIQTKI